MKWWWNIEQTKATERSNYKEYFKELGLKTQNINGLYIDQDQDEIILFTYLTYTI